MQCLSVNNMVMLLTHLLNAEYRCIKIGRIVDHLCFRSYTQLYIYMCFTF